MVQHDESSHFVTVNSRVDGYTPDTELLARMPFGQFELVAVRIADPGAQAHTVGSLLERADERNTFLFQDRAKLPKVTRVDTNVNVCGRYFTGAFSLRSSFNSRNGSLALSPYPTRPTSTFRASLACHSFTFMPSRRV